MPTGFLVLQQTSTAILPDSRMTVRLGDDLIASLPVDHERFRTTQSLVVIPATTWPLQRLFLQSSVTQTIDGRTLATAFQHISLMPTTLPRLPNLWYTGWLLAVYAGIRTVMRRGATHHAIGIFGICTAGFIGSTYYGVTHWYIGGVTAMIGVIGASTAAWPHVQSHWQRFVHRPVILADLLAPGAHQYRADIDGLRALAVGAVVCYHAFPAWFPGGFIGVDVFFVISGFLITNIFITQLQQGTFHIGDFYQRRIRRIFPALIVVLVVTLVIGWVVLFRDEFVRLGWHVASGAGFVANITIFREVGYFAESALHTPLLHLWSLGIEEQFYLIWPLFLWWWARQPQHHWWILLGAIGGSFLAGVIMVYVNRDAAFFLIPTRFWQLACGGAVAVWQRGAQPYRTLPAVAGIIGSLGILGATWGYHEQMLFPGALALVPTLASMLVIASDEQSWLNRRILGHSFLVFIGLISYPLYLWHWPLISYGYLIFESQFTHWWRALVVVISVVLSIATYTFIERPLRFGRWRHTSVQFLVIGMLTVAGSALAGISTGIIPARQHTTVATPAPTPLPTVACDQVFRGTPVHTRNDSLCLQVIATDAHTPEYIVIGDSHSGALALGFAQASVGHPMRSYMLPGCLPGLNIERYDDAEQTAYDCSNPGNYTAVMTNLIAEPTTRARIIVVVGRFSSITGTALNPNHHEQIHVQGPGPRRELSVSARSDVVSTGLRALIQPLTALPNTRVIIVQQVPEFDFTPNNCMRLASLTGTTTFCRTNRDRINAHARVGNDMLHTAIRGLAHVELYDPWPLLCDALSCSPLDANQQLLYRDSHHLNDVGGIRVAQQMAHQFTPRK